MATAKKSEEAAEVTAKAYDPTAPVKIKLFKDNGKYNDDVTVGWNGRFWQIQRGKEVEVPAGVAEIIEQSLAQRQEAAEFIAANSK